MQGRSRAERKAAAVLRAQLSLKQAIERVDYDFDVIVPELLKIRELEKGNTVEVAGELEVGDADALGLA